MAPTSNYMATEYNEEPISRTYQYRKVMKPMLERKRRARINRCLDELKELMVTALQSEGENVSKLEKADILELTVRHLHSLKSQHQLVKNEQNYADRFRAGFTRCAQEVSQFISSPSDYIDPNAGRKLLQHLGACVRQLDNVSQFQQQEQQQQEQQQQEQQQQQQQNYSPPVSPASNINPPPTHHQMWRPW